MRTGRSLNLQIFLDRVEGAVMARGDAKMKSAAAKVFRRLSESTGQEIAVAAHRRPVCANLEAVYSGMEALSSPLPELASAFMTLESHLNWKPSGRQSEDPAFENAHANAMIAGPGGIEQRNDVMIGVSLLAPRTTYPDHSHPPEEVYLAFTAGEWWNAGMDWTEPGPGGLIYNPPGVLHAMRAGAKPMLAVWLLPVGP